MPSSGSGGMYSSGVALGDLDVGPLLALAQLPRLAQHAGGQIHAIDLAGGTDGRAQMRKIAAGAASDLQHAVAGRGPDERRRAAQVWREKEQPVEQADQAGNTIVTLRDERTFTIHPMVSQLFRPLHARGPLVQLIGAAA